MTEPLLAVDGVVRSFGGIRALSGVSFTRSSAGICGLIGPNGAGKTTLFDAISGRIAVDAGSVCFAGEELLPLPAHRRVTRGVVRTFQECRIFGEKTCLENLLFALQRKGLAGALKRMMAGDRGAERLAMEECGHYLALVGLADYATAPAAMLSYGQKRLLEIASALLMRPRLLLLDEPAAGVNPALLETLHDFLLRIRRETEILILIVEHNMQFIMSLADHIVVMHQGSVLEEGAPAQIQASSRVIEAYLG